MATTKIFGYVRVSSKEQNISRQIDSLKKYVPNERDILFDKLSGKDFNRPAFQALKNMVRTGDTVYIHEMDRLGRNRREILENLQYFKNAGVYVRILNIPTTLIDFSQYGDDVQRLLLEMVNNIMLEVLATLAEKERRDINRRQREGIEAAHRRGTKFGRPSKLSPEPESWKADLEAWRAGTVTAISLCKKYDISRPTFYSMVKKTSSDF